MGNFTLDMQKFVKKANANADIAVKRIVAGVAESVVMMSPVGDASYWSTPAPVGYIGGRFRGNWDYGFNTIPSNEYGTIDASGSVSIGRVDTGMLGKPTSGLHYIANNVPYSQRLEDGWSRQSPNGMVSLTVIKFQSIVDEAAKGLA